MNKRGQVFLIAAIILVLALYSVVIEYNTIKTYQGLEDYKDLSENYQSEYPKVINFAIYDNADPVSAADDFTNLFLQQANKKDPNFGVFYIYKDNSDNLHIVNTLNNKALKLEYTEPLTAEQVNLSLLPARGPANGELCVSGLGCNTVSAFIGDFDQAYYKVDINDVKRLGISILGEEGGLPINLDKFTSMIYLRSEEQGPLDDAPPQVAVSLQQY